MTGRFNMQKLVLANLVLVILPEYWGTESSEEPAVTHAASSHPSFPKELRLFTNLNLDRSDGGKSICLYSH